MYKLCRVDLERSREILDGLERYKGEVVARLAPTKIILFGSFARGDIHEGSDVDLIVVAGWTEGFLDRIKILLELNQFGIPLEPIGYTEEEFHRMEAEGNSFVIEILREGKLIYENPSTAAVDEAVRIEHRRA